MIVCLRAAVPIEDLCSSWQAVVRRRQQQLLQVGRMWTVQHTPGSVYGTLLAEIRSTAAAPKPPLPTERFAAAGTDDEGVPHWERKRLPRENSIKMNVLDLNKLTSSLYHRDMHPSI